MTDNRIHFTTFNHILLSAILLSKNKSMKQVLSFLTALLNMNHSHLKITTVTKNDDQTTEWQTTE